MDVYLPVAELSVDLLLLLGLGAAVGFLSGVFGVGGGFLITPLLIFIGIPPAVAVGTAAPQVLASSVSGVLAHLRRGAVDVKMGLVLTAGGFLGSAMGVLVFRWLWNIGQVETTIALGFVFLLAVVGTLMLVESGRALLRYRAPVPRPSQRAHRHFLLHRLPLKMRFHESRLYISALLPLAVGAVVGLLAAVLGVGGAFVMIPAMIYLIGMPTRVVVGTSLLQVGFVTALTTFLHAYNNQTVDIVLAVLLIVGGAIGAQLGARAGTALRGEQLRVLFALLTLLVCARLAWDLVAEPDDLYSLAP
ncbi:MAG: sulfite exporter TauE/SafE family protein [Geminicoccaceae bacterium]|nr:sulfite exporter TauE/SafE family protein [Geminicoccaceae bacterium]MCS7268656.1 sulfite exporter TauE/SafE family protein [Geminicoccaceae bacterium]MCX7630996.1 sulfite exporter TauE/SafE family protein [Geminicoccaceae bacterium]MDW8124719.1 sulfite exporter TauE/SafE family protein [Geminicoccaceae bacterium]MDW8341517.1 sulfite exporter TauE/SafE family protein [Geminicoccaceae bacterium]